MENHKIPILDFDPQKTAILNPGKIETLKPVPRIAVFCFFQEVLQKLVTDGKLESIGHLKSEMGPNPIYQLKVDGKSITIMHPGVGAPLAAGFLEEMIAQGVHTILACGGVGALKPEIVAGHLVILTEAVRDEGTSYHYLPAGQTVFPDQRCTEALEKVLIRQQLPYIKSKSWTTDAIYRETCAIRDQRVAEGCDVVEMEAAAFFAVAEFRNIAFGQLVYGGDLVVPEGWDGRAWDERLSVRENLFWLTVEAALDLAEDA
jgi:purine-nucleoside phosphorylase